MNTKTTATDHMADMLGYLMRGIAADIEARKAAQGTEEEFAAYLLATMTDHLDSAERRQRDTFREMTDRMGWMDADEWMRTYGVSADALHAALVAA